MTEMEKQAAISTIINAIKAASPKAVSAVKTQAPKVVNAVKTQAPKVANAVKTTGSKIPDMAKSFASKIKASGTAVPKPTSALPDTIEVAKTKSKFPSAGALLTGAMVVGGVGTGVGAAINEIKKPEVPEDNFAQERIDGTLKTAANKNNDDRGGDKEYYRVLPYAAGGTALALAGLQLAKTKSPKAVLKTLRDAGAAAGPKMADKAMKDFAKRQKGPVRLITDFAPGVLKAGKRNLYRGYLGKGKQDIVNMYENAGLANPKIQGRSEYEKDAIDWWLGKHKEYHDKMVANPDKDFIDGIVKNYAKRNQINISDMSEKKVEEIIQAEKNKFAADKKFVQSKNFKEFLLKSNPGLEDINKSIGQGAAFGLGSFAVYGIGDKYFDKKDNDDMKKLLRERYNDQTKTVNNAYLTAAGGQKQKYYTPKERVGYKQYQQNQKQAFIGSDALDKIAAAIPNAVKDFAQKHKEPIKEVGWDMIGNNVLKASRYAGSGAAAAGIIGLANKKDGKKQNLNRTVIEIPIEKSAVDVSDIAEPVKAFSKKNIGRVFKEQGKEFGGSLVWSLASAIPANQAMRAYSSGRSKDQVPLDPGKARITIETSPDDGGMGYYNNAAPAMRKRASSEEFLKDNKKSVDEIVSSKEDEKDARRADLTLATMDLVRGIRRKAPMLR